MIDQARFWSKVRKGSTVECWPWTGAHQKEGYGRFKVNGKLKLTHRLSFEIATSKPIPQGLLVCHTCDNPACVNPRHLFLGTYSDNRVDCIRKGRSAKPTGNEQKAQGEEVGTSKLKNDDVPIILKLRREGKSAAAIARQYGVHKTQICRILKGVSWRSVTGFKKAAG